MKTRMKTIILVVFIFSVVIPDMAMAEKAVAWIMGGYNDCKVTRYEYSKFKDYAAVPEMRLFAGDRVYKKDNIKNVRFEYLPYYEPKIKDDSTAIIINNAPEDKETIFAKFLDWLGLVKTKYKEYDGRSRGPWVHEAVSMENAPLLSGHKISFDDSYKGKTGLKPGKMYIREIKIGETLDFRSTIRVLGKKDEKIVNKALAKIDREKISAEEKIIKKAAYLQYISDLYPAQVDLYWLSFQLLRTSDITDEKLLKLHKILLGSCFDHLKGGITEVDFALLLDRPGCLVTVELTRELETNFVPPDFPFKNYDEFSLHFQVNFDGYLVVLNESGEQTDLAFPVESTGHKVKSRSGYRSCTYRFVRKPSIKDYLFILSDKPLEEMEQYGKLTGNRVKCGELNTGQQKLLLALSKRAKEQGQELKLEIIGSKSFAKLPGNTVKGITWFQVFLEN